MTHFGPSAAIPVLGHESEEGFDEDAFRVSFATAARRCGPTPFVATAVEIAELAKLGISWPLAQQLDELMRTALLISGALRLTTERFARLVSECYGHGDLLERQAVLRALPLLPEATRFLDLAVEACRSHIQSIFEAIACENPYPAEYFPDLNFNQMVLKALFTAVPLNRIIGLRERVTPELKRMANDYASERKAANRAVPSDIDWLLQGDCILKGGQATQKGR